MHSYLVIIAAVAFARLISPTVAEATERDSAFARCVQAAEELVRQLPGGDDQNSGFGALAGAYANRGDLDRVRLNASQITDNYVQALVLINVASGWSIRRGNRVSIDALLRSASESAEKVSSESLRDYLYWLIAIGQAANDQVEHARNTLELIRSPERRDGVLSSIAAAHARQSDLEKAWATVISIPSGPRRDWALQGLVFTLAKAGDLTGARAYTHHTGNTERALASIVRARAEIGDFGYALRLAHDITNPAARMGALRTIAENHGRHGQREEAAAAFGAARAIVMTLAAGRAWYLSDMASSQVRAGLIEDALATVDEFESLPESDLGKAAYNLIFPLSMIAQAQAKMGNHDAARATLARARQSRLLAKDDNASATLVIVSMAMMVGDVALARSIAKELPIEVPIEIHPPPGLAALQRIAVGFAKSGDFDGAVEAVADIDAVRRRDYIGDNTLKDIAVELARQGFLDRALEAAADIVDVKTRIRALTEMAVTTR